QRPGRSGRLRLRRRQLPVRPGTRPAPPRRAGIAARNCRLSRPLPTFATQQEAAMDLRKIKALIDLLDKSNLAELEIKEGEESVRLARHSSVAPPMMMQAPQMMAMPAADHGHRPAAPAAGAPTPALAATDTEAQP